MIDQIIVLSYLALSLIIGLLAGRNTISLEDYAIGKRNFSNFALAAGIAATMISASGTSGLTGKIYIFGLISIISFFGVVVSRMLVAFLVAPRMENFLGLISAGDIFEKLYGKNAKILIGLLTLIEGPLLAGSQVLATYQALQIFFNISKEAAAISTTVIIVAYCFRGGIRSVTATDVFQFIIIMIAIPIIATFAIYRIGGLEQFVTLLTEKHLLADSMINGDKFKHLTIFISISITCVFPLTIQRMLMAKNVTQIKRAFFINGIVTFLFYVAIGAIGLSAAILLPGIDPNFALPTIIEEILPVGIRGLVIAGLIAIFMSSADSDMNITAVALTQDLLKPIFGQKLNSNIIFTITRLSFILSGIFAIVIALYYSNALDVLFIIMTIANSIYFPGMFFGIIGISPSKNGFWTGALVGALIAAVMCWGYHIFPLYAMMTAIIANSSIILCSYFLMHVVNKKPLKDLLFNHIKTLKNRNTFFEFKKSNYLVSASSYCDIFAIIVLINSMAPFFLNTIYLNHQPVMAISLNIVGSILAVLLLLRQSFGYRIKPLVPIIWQITVFISLTLSGAISITQSPFSLLLAFDLIAIFSLLILLLEKYEFLIHIFLFIIFSVTIIFSGIYNNTITADIHYWSLFLHGTALVLCLILFRKREVAAYKFMSMKFVHEAGRTISSVSTSALLLEQWLPKLIKNYRENEYGNLSLKSNSDLNIILNIPNKLTSTSVRTWDNLNNMASWMDIKKHEYNFSLNSIKQSLQSALDDNSLAESIKSRINVETSSDFIFYGNNMQISNVVLNLIENAGHAIKNVSDSSIYVWTDNNSLFIKDTGAGISKKNLPNIFDEFFSTKGTSGQGLAFCKLIMEQHNGNISCESELGKYTQFTLSFPIVSITKEISP